MANTYAVRRLLQLVPQLFILTIISFGILHLAPGDPTSVHTGGETSATLLTAEQVKALRAHYGLDRPLNEQYLRWLQSIVTLDFGRSYSDGRPVAERIGARVWPTFVLTFTALLISLLAVPLGIVAAYWRNSLIDYLTTFIAFLGVSLPSFWMGIIAILLFGLWLRWLPVGGMTEPGEPATVIELARHLALPAIVLGFGGMAGIVRYVRSSMLEALLEDYIRTARAKGLQEITVLSRHALKNALLPIITIMGLSLPHLISGAALVETVFSWPGIGRAAVEAAFSRDYPMTMALVVIIGTLTILGNLIADLCYGALDPRIRVGK